MQLPHFSDRLFGRRCVIYEAINASIADVYSTTFIEFALSAIKASLMEVIAECDEMSNVLRDKAREQLEQIDQFLEGHDVIENVDVRQLCGVAAATPTKFRPVLRQRIAGQMQGRRTLGLSAEIREV